MHVELDLTRFRNIYGRQIGVNFCWIVPPGHRSNFSLSLSEYDRTTIVEAAPDEVPGLLTSLRRPSHVFCITAYAPFRSPPPGVLQGLKLGVLPFYSTGYSPEKLQKAIRLITEGEYAVQHDRSQRLIAHLAAASALSFSLPDNRAQAELKFGSATNYYFFNQSGPIKWGFQSVLPSGEVSILTDGHGSYSETHRFKLTGRLPLHGHPVLHRGRCPCAINRLGIPGHFQCDDVHCSMTPLDPLGVSDYKHRTLFADLARGASQGAIATLEEGVITRLEPMTEDHTFCTSLEQLFAADDRYTKIHELGFGLNKAQAAYRSDNFLPNEMIEGVHFGLGLTPFTEFHLDIVCPGIEVRVQYPNRESILLL